MESEALLQRDSAPHSISSAMDASIPPLLRPEDRSEAALESLSDAVLAEGDGNMGANKAVESLLPIAGVVPVALAVLPQRAKEEEDDAMTDGFCDADTPTITRAQQRGCAMVLCVLLFQEVHSSLLRCGLLATVAAGVVLQRSGRLASGAHSLW